MKITVIYGGRFLKNAQRLPHFQQKKLAQLLETLGTQPFDSRLHTKPLSGRLTGFYSCRITRDWRIIFQFVDAATIKLVDVAHRREIYR